MLSLVARRCASAAASKRFHLAAARPIATTWALSDSDKGRPPIHVDAPSDAPTIPPFIENFEEAVDAKRLRLQYQSRKRGMLENGLLLGSFASEYLQGFDEEQLALYDRLINLPSNDWEIFYWATGVKPTPPEFDNQVMDLLKQHTKNERRESRITMPNLKQ